MFNISDPYRNAMQLDGPFSEKGYDWWWHSFTAYNAKTGEERQFFIEYFLVNPELGQDYPVFGQLPENKARGIRPSYMMVKAGCWGPKHKQLNRFFGWSEVEHNDAVPFRIQAGSCYASDDHIMGHVKVTAEDAANHPEYMSDYGSMFWDLKVNKKIAFNVGYGASTPLRIAKAFQMYWHAEGMKTTYDGEIFIDGERYIADPTSSYGYADKNWGNGFTTPWLWLSSCCIYSERLGRELRNSAFDIGGGNPTVYGYSLGKKLLGALYLEGAEYEYNFSKPWELTNTQFKVSTKGDRIRWQVWMDNYDSLIKVDVTCRKKDMICINYEDPNGVKVFNELWNGGNGRGQIRLYSKSGEVLSLVDRLKITHVGCEWGEK